MQIPLGIYNEVRDVGTVLPFYRPSFNFYGEGAFTSETVDGIVVSHNFFNDSAWSVDADAYFGGWDLIETDFASNVSSRARVENTVGTQIWLNTPINGLRLGTGGSRFTVKNDLLAGIAGKNKIAVDLYQFSIDGSFEKVIARTEFEYVKFLPGHYRAYYAQFGYRVCDKLMLLAQGDFASLRLVVPPGAVFDRSLNRDYAIGANYAFRSNVVLKVETHWVKGFRSEIPINIFFDPPLKSRYTILSISCSF